MRPAKHRIDQIDLASFGCVVGLVFVDGGAAEISMRRGEVSRILEALTDLEKSRRKPDQRLVAALEVVCRKLYSRFERVRIVAEVPIATRRARITPIIEELSDRPIKRNPKIRSIRDRD